MARTVGLLQFLLDFDLFPLSLSLSLSVGPARAYARYKRARTDLVLLFCRSSHVSRQPLPPGPSDDRPGSLC
jgi:hypothetical protein